MSYDTSSYRKAEDIRFFKALQDVTPAEVWWKDLCTIKDSKTLTEDYAWLGDLPGVKEWLDERQINSLKKFTYSLTNKDWEDTIGIDVNKLKDNPGFVENRIPMLAKVMARHPNELVANLMVDGTTKLCYDGLSFYNTAHPIDGDSSDTFSNLLAGAGVSVANIQTDLGKIIVALLTMKDRNGNPKFDGIGILRLFYPAALEVAMREAVKAQKASGGADNIYFDMVQLQPSGRLTDVKDWYWNKLDAPIKPFVYQNRQPIRSEWDRTEEFKRKKILFGVDARYEVGYTLPELSGKINNT